MSTDHSIRELVYIGRDNSIDLQLQDDVVNPGTLENADLSSATKVGVVIDGTTAYDSTANPTVVSFTVAGVVSLRLGSVITTEGEHRADIVIFDPVNTNGYIWHPPVYLEAFAGTPPYSVL